MNLLFFARFPPHHFALPQVHMPSRGENQPEYIKTESKEDLASDGEQHCASQGCQGKKPGEISFRDHLFFLCNRVLSYSNETGEKNYNLARTAYTHLGTPLLIGAQILTLAEPYEHETGGMDGQ